MLKSITLRNFQRLKTAHVEFSDGVTTIHGPTDSGKSSLIRALQWLFLNEAPDAAPKFFTWGSKFASVTGMIDDHKLVRRRKQGGRNSYILDGKRLDAVRTDVPEPVAHVTQVTPTNFQDQHSPAFWLSDTPGAVSRQLNQIINLEDIDTALSKAASLVRSTKTEADIFKQRSASSKKARDNLAWTEECEVELAALESLEDKIKESDKQIEDLSRLIHQIKTIDTELGQAKEVRHAIDGLRTTASIYVRLEHQANELESVLQRLEHVETRSAELLEAGAKLKQQAKDLEVLDSQCRELGRLVKSVQAEENEICEAESELKSLRRRLKSLGSKVCPACGRPLMR